MLSLTFDDGWKNQYSRAFPVLERNNIKATFYIISKMPEYMLKEGEGRMSDLEIKDLAHHGHEIGAHSRTHPHLHRCFPWKIKKEVLGSKKDLESKGLLIDTFCFPYGERNWYVDRAVKQAGFSGARLAEGGHNTKGLKRFALEARCLRNFTSIEEVYLWIDESKGKDKWLILVFHQIEPNPPSWGTDPTFFNSICDYIKRNQIETTTVSDGIKKFL